jgi:membrane associated rhomboid family serine protease
MIMEPASLTLVAVAIFGHAWVSRISAPAPVVNACGWVVAVLATLALASPWVHCG